MSKRASGVLLHPTSLPGPYGIGDLGSSAIDFLDWLQRAGQTSWQVLPLGPVGQGNSPYNAQSSFAGNLALIDLEGLHRWNLIDRDALDSAKIPQTSWVDFNRVVASKRHHLHQAWQNLASGGDAGELRSRLSRWAGASEQASWLDSWTLYAALKHRHGGESWSAWPEPFRNHQSATVEQAREESAEELRFQEFVQFVFFEQWQNLRSEARARGIALVGDLPFYVAMDSCEVWTQPELFDLDASGAARTVAGVPPDYFSDTGQRWGNPTYRWKRHREQGFRWWIDRLRHQMRLVDRLRLDHFRGFAAYWEIPADHTTATDGVWRVAPGKQLFEAAAGALGGLPFIAEDLGVITPDVEQLRNELDLPGMKVLQFAFDSADSPHLPHNLTRNTVLYTGTHDNNTARGWFEDSDPETRARILCYTGGTPELAHWSLIRTAQTSVADLVVIPAQDVAGLDASHRMNTPGTADGNWGWRMSPETLTPDLAAALRELTAAAGRVPDQHV